MAADARDPAWENGASDDKTGSASDATPCDDPPPPGFLDLGNGDLLGAGTAADCRAAAAWLQRNYPEHSQDPPSGHTGPIYNMGHELTRELRASQLLPELGRPEQAVALDLADICRDATRRPPQNMNAGARVCEDLGIPMGTLGNILAKLAARGLEVRVPIGKDRNGRLVYAAKGHALDFLFPPLPPRAAKGPLNDGPLTPEPVDNPSEADSKGPQNDGPMEVIGPPNDGAMGAKGPRFEAQRSTESWTPTPMTPKSKEDARRVGDPIADKLHQDQRQGQDQEPGALRLPQVANSQKPASSRLNDQPMADEAQEIPFHAETATTTGSCARESPKAEPLSESAEPADSDATTPPESFEDVRRRELDRFEAWMREHPEAVGQ